MAGIAPRRQRSPSGGGIALGSGFERGSYSLGEGGEDRPAFWLAAFHTDGPIVRVRARLARGADASKALLPSELLSLRTRLPSADLNRFHRESLLEGRARQSAIQANKRAFSRVSPRPDHCRSQLQGICGAQRMPLNEILRQFPKLLAGLYLDPHSAKRDETRHRHVELALVEFSGASETRECAGRLDRRAPPHRDGLVSQGPFRETALGLPDAQRDDCAGVPKRINLLHALPLWRPSTLPGGPPAPA